MMASAQIPTGKLPTSQIGTPTMPVNILPIEVVVANPSTMMGSTVYERAGLKPKQFRIGSSPQMTGANWMTFTEGATSTKTANGRTVTGSCLRGAFD